MVWSPEVYHNLRLASSRDVKSAKLLFYLKTQLGLQDFRVRSYEAVDKYIVAVHLAWAYVEQRFAQERSAQVRTYGDIIRQHRDEHAIDWLKGAIEMAVETGDPELVLRRFLRLET